MTACEAELRLHDFGDGTMAYLTCDLDKAGHAGLSHHDPVYGTWWGACSLDEHAHRQPGTAAAAGALKTWPAVEQYIAEARAEGAAAERRECIRLSRETGAIYFAGPRAGNQPADLPLPENAITAAMVHEHIGSCQNPGCAHSPDESDRGWITGMLEAAAPALRAQGCQCNHPADCATMAEVYMAGEIEGRAQGATAERDRILAQLRGAVAELVDVDDARRAMWLRSLIDAVAEQDGSTP